MPSPLPGESCQGDKAWAEDGGPRGTHPRPILTHSVSVQVPLVCSWPVAHLPNPLPPILPATCERRGHGPLGTSLPRLVRVWLDQMRSGPPGRILASMNSPQRGSRCSRGRLRGPLMPNRLRQLRFLPSARREGETFKMECHDITRKRGKTIFRSGVQSFSLQTDLSSY